MDTDALTIGEVAERVGIRQTAIRYYEEIGLVRPPPRAGGWRRFTPEAVDRLRVIRTARELGFTLEEIQLLLEGFSPDTPPPVRWRELARRKLPEIDGAVTRALGLRRLLQNGIDCRCLRIEDCFLEECIPASPQRPALPVLGAAAGTRSE
jgi:MerR family transcriptional regulator, redox-sensitive transcriptional activator SoxR